MNATDTRPTSVVGAAPEITAPVRLEGESDSAVLFTWLKVHQFLWLLEPPHDDVLRKIVGPSVELELTVQLAYWKRKQPQRAKEHQALTAPEGESSR